MGDVFVKALERVEARVAYVLVEFVFTVRLGVLPPDGPKAA